MLGMWLGKEKMVDRIMRERDDISFKSRHILSLVRSVF